MEYLLDRAIYPIGIVAVIQPVRQRRCDVQPGLDPAEQPHVRIRRRHHAVKRPRTLLCATAGSSKGKGYVVHDCPSQAAPPRRAEVATRWRKFTQLCRRP